MIPYWMSRTQLLLGDEPIQSLMNKHVLVVGLGGVGGICAEMIVRSGVGKITIVDADTVDLSNANRQIPALHSTAGKLKSEVMAERLKLGDETTPLTTYDKATENLDCGDFVQNMENIKFEQTQIPELKEQPQKIKQNEKA